MRFLCLVAVLWVNHLNRLVVFIVIVCVEAGYVEIETDRAREVEVRCARTTKLGDADLHTNESILKLS